MERRREGKEVCNTMPRLERAIQRVGDAPIDLSISLNWSHAAIDIKSTMAMITRVAETCARWRTLHIENSEKVLQGNYALPLNLFDQGLPNLISASFHMQHHNHGEPSRGLIPFGRLVGAIEKTSEKLHSVHFHGFGHNELTDSYFSSPMRIEDLSLIHVEPRYIPKGHKALLDACPTSRAGWRYAAFAGLEDISPISVREASYGFIVPNRRITLHGDIHSALRENTVNDLQVLDIITTSPLRLSRKLHLPRVYQLSVYSSELDDLRLIYAPSLNNFRIALSSDEEHHVHASILALERLWSRATMPHPVRVSLERVGISGTALRNLAVNDPRLQHVKLVNVMIERYGTLLGLTEAKSLIGLDIMFTEQLDVGRVEKLCADIRTLMLARKDDEVKLEKVTLSHGTEEEVFDHRTIE